MKKKAIMLLSEDQTLSDMVAEMESHQAMFHQKLEFLKRQAKTASEEYDKLRGECYEKMEDRLEEIGKLPSEYDRSNENHVILFSTEENLVSWHVKNVCESCGGSHPTDFHSLPAGIASFVMKLRDNGLPGQE